MAAITASPDPYDGALSAIPYRVDDLGAWLAIWEGRPEPDGHARRCALDTVDAIDTMLRQLYLVRWRLSHLPPIEDIRAAPGSSAAMRARARAIR